MALHFEGSSERTQSASELITPAGFEVYGQAPATAIDQLRREADSIDARFHVFANPLGGFLRAHVEPRQSIVQSCMTMKRHGNVTGPSS